MTGVHTGVATNTYVVGIHCVAHRLALAASQASNSVPYMKSTFNNALTNLFYFYQNSPVRMSGLDAIQTVMNDPEIKLKAATSVRWLSHERACQALRSTLPSVFVSLEREATERSEPIAAGLLKMIIYNIQICSYIIHVS